jgi:hypothetical protein
MKWPPTPSFFLNCRQFLLLHKRCNHRSDGTFQILSRNLLAVSGDVVQLIFTTRGHLAQRYQNWLLVYKQYKDPAAFFGICYENLLQICTNWLHF